MPLETLKEMTQREDAERTRAWKYGKAKDTAWTATERLKSLEAKIAAPQPDVEALQQIEVLAREIPPGLQSVGTRFNPGGEMLQTVILREVSAALGFLAQQRQDLVDALPKAREAAAQAQQRLAEFESEAR
jgi:hypothetical protein